MFLVFDRSLSSFIHLGLLFFWASFSLSLVASANSFEVYCTINGDQTTTCAGWDGDQDLVCVDSAGGALSCRASSGEEFVCVRNLGATSCTNQNRSNSQTTQCVFDGGGTSSCARPDPQSAPLLEVPTISEPSIDVPSNLIVPSFGSPSVF